MPLLLDIPETRAALGGISRTHLYRLINAGEIGNVKIGRRRLIPLAEIEAYIARTTRYEGKTA